ncbi:MAG: ribonuclease HII [Bacteroidota bacterium]
MKLDFELDLWKSGIENIAGVDEAGRGPLAGPVVAAAVVFPRGIVIDGVDDSKKLTPGKREELYPIIRSHALSVGFGIVDHEVIDRINILQASLLAMRKALAALEVVPGLALVDGNSFRHETIPFRTVIDGDARCFSIAAASILAKVTRDRIMVDFDRRFPGYGFARHKGYGTKEHREALRQLGLCEIHRRSFGTARMMVAEKEAGEMHRAETA